MTSHLLKISIYLILLQFFLACSPVSEEQKFLIGFAQCCDDAWRDVMNAEMRRELTFHPELDFEMRVAGGNSELQIEQIRAFGGHGHRYIDCRS